MENKNTTSESSIEKYFVKECKKRKMKILKMIPTFEAGIPDRQVLFKGISGFAELKAPTKKPRVLQVAYMKNLKNAGFFVGVIDSRESALQWIAEFTAHIEKGGVKPTFCCMCGKQSEWK
jgi:hypothetical protein